MAWRWSSPRADMRFSITDPFEEVRASVKERIAATLRSLGQEGAAVERVTVVATLAEAVRAADIVIEAAPEKLDLKQQIFAELEAASRPDALLCSNTSVIPIAASRRAWPRGSGFWVRIGGTRPIWCRWWR